MPVQKFRSVVDMPRVPWPEKLDDAFLDRVGRLWARSALISPRKYPKGVRKYRSIEEAQADRERWLTENIERLREERKTQPVAHNG